VTRAISALILLLLAGGTVEAQGPVVKYGKWLLVAGSIGMNYFALQSHNRADDALDVLSVPRGNTPIPRPRGYIRPLFTRTGWLADG
jgi:hypothetical protein